MRNRESDPQQTAQAMIQLHGLRAQATALARVEELRRQNDTSELERWEAVHAAICELRRTASSARAGRAA
jgi:hypothetical protein